MCYVNLQVNSCHSRCILAVFHSSSAWYDSISHKNLNILGYCYYAVSVSQWPGINYFERVKA